MLSEPKVRSTPMKMDPKQYAEALAGLDLHDDKVVIESAHKLGDFGERHAVPSLIRTMMNAESPSVRDAAATGLRDLGDHR
jgi:HEAT repeat protein